MAGEVCSAESVVAAVKGVCTEREVVEELAPLSLPALGA